MARNFRLIRAAGAFERRDLAHFGEPRPPINVHFSDYPKGAREGVWVTVVIGKNGVGKSRLLAGIADIFDAIERGTGRKRRDDLLVSELEYWCDGQLCRVESEGTYALRASIDGVRCSIGDLPLPTKVIALTTTPFDKFRVPRQILVRDDAFDAREERYAYLGLRDRSGRASTTAAIFRALEGLFLASRSEAPRRERIAGIFSFLSYRPHVVVRYEMSDINRKRLQKLASGESIDRILEDRGPRTYRRPLDIMLDREPDLLSHMREVARETLERANGGRYFQVRVDFLEYSGDEEFFPRLQILRRADLLRMRAVEIEREDGTVLDLKLASSGELGIVTCFLGLASAIEDGSLVFVDEPEISLHPEWQTRYVDLLLRTFGVFSGSHFVLATHSPLILSDIAPETSNVVSLDPDRGEAQAAEEFSGQSADFLLVNAFETPGKNNLYLKGEVVKALRLAADGKAASTDYAEVVEPMVKILPNLEEASPVATLIRELDTVGEKARQAR